jgi:hypothetical protein
MWRSHECYEVTNLFEKCFANVFDECGVVTNVQARMLRSNECSANECFANVFDECGVATNVQARMLRSNECFANVFDDRLTTYFQ